MRSTIVLLAGAAAVGFVLGTRANRPVVRESRSSRLARRASRRR